MKKYSRRDTLTLSASAVLATPVILASATTASAATHNVNIEGFKFDPKSLNAAVGDTVIFTNVDGAPHTATANDGSFDTGRLNRGNSAEVTLSSAGTYDYFCSFHRNMKATITVA